MARTKTSSIIKTRSQSRTGTKAHTTDPAAPVAVATGRTTGTNDRTNDDTIQPVAVVTTTDVAPAPAAGRTTLKAPSPAVPNTGLKPAPRDRGSDSDDDANKKPAAKPTKGRPKKVVARKPRTDPAEDLVDPMSRVQVHDATGVVTAGGIARAGGNDPVLADPDYKKSGTPRSGTVR